MNPNLYVLQSLLWLKTEQQDKLAQAVTYLIGLYYEKPEVWASDKKQYSLVLEGGKLPEGRSQQYIDRSVIPRLLKVVASCLTLNIGNIERLGTFLDTIYSDLRRDRHTGTVFRDMWATRQYQISYTERAIEALTLAYEACPRRKETLLTFGAVTLSGALDSDSLSQLARSVVDAIAMDEHLSNKLGRIINQESETPDGSVAEIAKEVKAGDYMMSQIEEASTKAQNQPASKQKQRRK